MLSGGAEAGGSRLFRRPTSPSVSADHRPGPDDGIFRIAVIASRNSDVAELSEMIKVLNRSPRIDVQVIASNEHVSDRGQRAFEEVLWGCMGARTRGEDGLWTDNDEWADWRKAGDPILHIELRRWADLVLVAPCSTNLLAKIACGLCDDLATSLLRALAPTTPVIVCPAINPVVFRHRITAKHIAILQDEFEYLVLDPQKSEQTSNADDGKMADWHNIIFVIEGYIAIRQHQLASRSAPDESIPQPSRSQTPPTPLRSPSAYRVQAKLDNATVEPLEAIPALVALVDSQGEGEQMSTPLKDWNSMTNGLGGDGRVWDKKWWVA